MKEKGKKKKQEWLQEKTSGLPLKLKRDKMKLRRKRVQKYHKVLQFKHLRAKFQWLKHIVILIRSKVTHKALTQWPSAQLIKTENLDIIKRAALVKQRLEKQTKQKVVKNLKEDQWFNR